MFSNILTGTMPCDALEFALLVDVADVDDGSDAGPLLSPPSTSIGSDADPAADEAAAGGSLAGGTSCGLFFGGMMMICWYCWYCSVLVWTENSSKV